jgi:FAD/FMN-containing dehydrogenase
MEARDAGGGRDDEATDRARAVYPARTYARLQAIKARYDPENLFRGNLNIVPANA